MWKFVKHHEFYLGSLIFLFSILWMVSFLGSYNGFVVLPLGISWIGMICLFDFFERKYFRHTIIPDTHMRKRKLFLIIAISLLFCVLLDGFGVFITQLWHYPFWSLKVYLSIAPFAYVAYSILLYILYEFVRDLVMRHKKVTTGSNVSRKIYVLLMKSELVLGIAGYILNILLITRMYSSLSFRFYILITFFVSTFCIFEYIGFRQNKQTLTHDILSGNWWPIIFIFIANAVAVIVIEFANTPFQVWTFANWPFDHIRFLNLPIVALLLWPIQFPVFLSMLRAVFPSREVVW